MSEPGVTAVLALLDQCAAEYLAARTALIEAQGAYRQAELDVDRLCEELKAEYKR